MASLWESRLSTEDVIPLDADPYAPSPSPPRRKPPRRRTDVSANKPPVAPPLAAGAAMKFVEEVPMSESALMEAMSPVSSFVSSTAVRSPPPSPSPSPRLSANPHEPDWIVALCQETAVLRKQVRLWDDRIRQLERRHVELDSDLARIRDWAQ